MYILQDTRPGEISFKGRYNPSSLMTNTTLRDFNRCSQVLQKGDSKLTASELTHSPQFPTSRHSQHLAGLKFHEG